jgi:hypothetical protein
MTPTTGKEHIVSRQSYKEAVDTLDTVLETARLANEQVGAEFAALGGAEGGSSGTVPDLIFKPLATGMLSAWRKRVAEAETFLKS